MAISGITTTAGVTRGSGVTLWSGETQNGGVTDQGIGSSPPPPASGPSFVFSKTTNSQNEFFLLDDWVM